MVKTSPTITIPPGQHIFYRNGKYIDDLEFVVLEKSALYCHCISAQPLKDEMPFDDNGNNDWNTSSLRKYLNEEYIKRFNQNDLIRFNGDLITLLSKEEVEKYKNILPKYSTLWWTRSPNVSYAYYAWYVYPSGQLGSIHAFYAHGVIPSCLFSLNNITILQEEDNIIFES